MTTQQLLALGLVGAIGYVVATKHAGGIPLPSLPSSSSSAPESSHSSVTPGEGWNWNPGSSNHNNKDRWPW